MTKYILGLGLVLSGAFSNSVHAAPVSYLCIDGTTKDIEISFDDLVIAGKNPPTADVEVSVSSEQRVKWTTPMFMGLKLPNVVFVQFRKESGPPDDVNLEIALDLQTATGNIYARDEGLDFQNLDCIKK